MLPSQIVKEIETMPRVWNWIKYIFSRKERKKRELISTRLVSLLESHGVHLNQIPRFLGHGLVIADVQNDELFLSKLNEEILNDVCSKFAVHREWLDGADSQIYPSHDFYKRLEEFESFICEIISNNPKGKLSGVLITPYESGYGAYALILLKEIVGYIGDKEIYRYHICNNWAFSYWKARAYLTACAAIAWKNGVYIHGEYLPSKQIEKLVSGETFLGKDSLNIGHKRWHPEDMALCPEKFLDGINPETSDFGIKSGLKLWLDLEEEGFMDINLRDNVREKFQKKLEMVQ